MRRLVALLLCFILLACCGLPCTETDTCAQPKSDQKEQPAHRDECAPLCTCSCCAAVVLPEYVAVPLRPKQPTALPVYPDRAVRFSSVLLNTVWQPPRIA